LDKKIDPDLFARLMRLSPPARKDLLEYLGQGPVSAKALLSARDDVGCAAADGVAEPVAHAALR
jgi:hypothetical protein